MKTINFKLSIKEIVKEAVITLIVYTVFSCICCAVAYPILKWNDKRRKAKEEKEETPSPESFSNVERAEDVRFTDEDKESE